LLIGLGLGVLGAAFSEKTGRRLMLALTGLFVIIGGIWLQLWWLTLLGTFVVVSPFLSHRTYTHTVWATVLWGYICHGASTSWRDPGVFWLGTLGYLSHLIADSLTKAGVKWFFPFWDRAFGLPLMRTGSRGGNRIEALITAGFAGIVITLWVGRLSK
jgi:inner membrane protein